MAKTTHMSSRKDSRWQKQHTCHPGKIAGGYLIRDPIHCRKTIIMCMEITDPG